MSLIPLGDASRRPVSMPVVTILIVLANVVMFGFEIAGGESFVKQWSAIPAEISSGHHLVTLLSSMFLHGSISHIAGNMLFLWVFGPEVEDAMGRWRYLLFYVAGGLVAMLAQIAGNPHSLVPNVGASGAIAAVMGGFLVLYPRDQIRTALFLFVFVRIRYFPAALLIGFWFLSQLVSLGGVATVEQGGVAYLAHVGGFVFGWLTTRLFAAGSRSPEVLARMR